MGTHEKHLGEALLMSTHNICFCAEIREILSGYALLSGAVELPGIILGAYFSDGTVFGFLSVFFFRIWQVLLAVERLECCF